VLLPASRARRGYHAAAPFGRELPPPLRRGSARVAKGIRGISRLCAAPPRYRRALRTLPPPQRRARTSEHAGGSGISQAARIILLGKPAQPPGSPQRPWHAASHEEREDAGIAVEPVVRDLAVAEKARQRKLAEGFADQLQLFGVGPEEAGAAPDAG